MVSDRLETRLSCIRCKACVVLHFLTGFPIWPDDCRLAIGMKPMVVKECNVMTWSHVYIYIYIYIYNTMPIFAVCIVHADGVVQRSYLLQYDLTFTSVHLMNNQLYTYIYIYIYPCLSSRSALWLLMVCYNLFARASAPLVHGGQV